VGVGKIDEVYGRWTKSMRPKLVGEQLDLNQFFKSIRLLPARADKVPPNWAQIVVGKSWSLKKRRNFKEFS
jgi:hypothetical protein